MEEGVGVWWGRAWGGGGGGARKEGGGRWEGDESDRLGVMEVWRGGVG